MADALTDAINHPAGRLTEIVIKQLRKMETGEKIPLNVMSRLDRLACAQHRMGTLARVRLAADVSLLFERAPGWTTKHVLPLFDWSRPNAYQFWNARKYPNFIGTPELFELTKAPFLELFRRPELAEDDLRVFSDWLTLIMIANRARNAGYPITPLEARSAVRWAGVRALESVGHRLAIAMGAAKPNEKRHFWREIIGPVFSSLWPLDAELQSGQVTFKLVQLLRVTVEAFPEAAELILPFIRAEDTVHHSSVYSIATADESLYTFSPVKILDILTAVVGDEPARVPYGLGNALDKIKGCAPELVASRRFQIGTHCDALVPKT